MPGQLDIEKEFGRRAIASLSGKGSRMSDVIEKTDGEEDEINLLDLLIVLARNKRLLILTPLCVGIITAVITLFMPNIYTASVKLMPPQQGSASSAAAMLSQLGGGALGGLAGGALGIKNQGDLYVGLFRSRTVSDRLIARFKLKERFKGKTMTGVRDRLQKLTTIASGKDGLISLSFDDEDPNFSASVANAYVEELENLMQGLAVTDAGRRRLYFEKQLKRAKDELAVAEVDLRRTQEKTGLIDPSAQGKAIIESIATIRAQIALREVTLGAMRSFATDINPDAIRIRSEIGELRNQLAKLEKPTDEVTHQGDTAIPSGKVPELGLEYARKLREVKYHEVLFELMAKQYEMARADEARDSGALQSVDKAIPPDRKTSPKRFIIILSACFASLFSVIAWIVFCEFAKNALAKNENRIKLDELKSYF